jgi:hypothetical protein
VTPLFDALIRSAIAERRLLQITYDEGLRLAEPHDYGVLRGTEEVFCWQREGASGEGWRHFFTSKISAVSLTDNRFRGGRPVSGRHIEWDELYASVSRKPFKLKR